MSGVDIYERYTTQLSSPNPHTPILAAIAALTDAIFAQSFSTVAEILSSIASLRSALVSKVDKPVLIDAGTASFERWLIQALGRADIAEEAGGEQDTIVQMGRQYIAEAMKEKEEMAKMAARIFPQRGGCQVIVPVWDNVIATVLGRAVAAGKRPTIVCRSMGCNVDTVDGPMESGKFYKGMQEQHGLFKEGNGAHHLLQPRDFNSILANSYSSQPRLVLATAAVNCANGGVLALSRCLSAAIVAKSSGVPFYIAGESFRNAGIYPLPSRGARTGVAQKDQKEDLIDRASKEGLAFIPADHIEAIFMSKYVYNSTRLADEIIKSWF